MSFFVVFLAGWLCVLASDLKVWSCVWLQGVSLILRHASWMTGEKRVENCNLGQRQKRESTEIDKWQQFLAGRLTPITYIAVCDSQDEKVVDFECHNESGSSSLGWKGN